MKNRFAAVILLVVGMAVGSAMTSYDRVTVATAAQQVSDDDASADALEQIKAIKTEVKEINALLQSGTLRVVVVINPDMR